MLPLFTPCFWFHPQSLLVRYDGVSGSDLLRSVLCSLCTFCLWIYVHWECELVDDVWKSVTVRHIPVADPIVHPNICCHCSQYVTGYYNAHEILMYTFTTAYGQQYATGPEACGCNTVTTPSYLANVILTDIYCRWRLLW